MTTHLHESSDSSPRYAVLFPGQGVQRPGMGEPWRATESWELVESVSRASGFDVAELLLTADQETLSRTDHAQISVFTASLLAWSELRRRESDARVVAVAGHSLGEYTALVAAGVLSVADGAWLVGERGRAMAEVARRRPGAMAAVMGGDVDEVAALVDTFRQEGADLWVANHNSPQQTVIAGSRTAIDAAASRAADAGLRYSVLPVSAACHSPYMEPASAALRRALELTHFAAGVLPVVANVDARAHYGGSQWQELSTRQLVSRVRWVESLNTLHEELDCTAFLDIGPGGTLAGLTRRALPGVPAHKFTAPAPLAVAA
ncbi:MULTISPECIES: ACP S-malonyltransferase [unclassified Streptomyces]|uniref:Malonyl CoA-acyl carrier protein transacylase n=1 Tax=Streptomyces sp. NBC_00119 TaxID=2975659 RepID=A0AAU1U912_9ACTN|nr:MULTISPECIES: ACP S-malonyltransferase [unclassified Streptomyces]MCX4644236.1 ACP S-malonyltransferase [Streptomyces sp. NBC_01446]MCX5325348.1 ACP S-malonyltransferase [Streptomyces sp. NBC_00120]